MTASGTFVRTTEVPARARSAGAVRSIARKPGDARRQVRQALGNLPVQPSLSVSQPEDAWEREAERVAEELVPDPGSAIPISGSPPNIRGLPPSNTDPGRDDNEDALTQRIRALSSRGRPLPETLQQDMEQRFGTDFRDVRIHTDTEAADLATRIAARAFTWRNHVVFGPGAWQPETLAGRRLLAHELTHVVQQRGGSAPAVQRWYVPLLSEAVDAIGDLVDQAGNFIAEQGWKLVRRYAPDLEPILRKGPFEWLKEKVSKAFEGVVGVLKRLNPLPHLRNLLTAFGGLLERGSRIMAALIGGDCEPLFKALRELRAFIGEIFGKAWDGLKKVLEPVKDFFRDVWSSFGAPAVDWLKRTAGDLWDWLQGIGRRIWAWLKPLRERIAAAWNWIKERLFGSDRVSGDGKANSESGLTAWLAKKAGEVWDWVKARTRPLWEPVRDAVAWIGELLPPAFVRELGESMQNLGQSLDQSTGDMQGGQGVARNRERLASILPSIEQVLTLVRAGLVRAKGWLVQKVGGLSAGLRNLLRQLRSSELLAWLARLLEWFDTLAEDFTGWAKDKVAGIFDWLVRGFDFLRPYLHRILVTVQRLVRVMTDLLQLPLLVAQALWQQIPECIRKPIEDFLVNQILRRIPVFGQLLAIPDLWQRVQDFAMRILRQVFVDGDLAGAAWTFFSKMLELIGLPPKLVMAILAKAARAIGQILTNPIGFLINVLKAMKAGFGRFFDNFSRYMLGGITGWLFGQLQEAGLTPPADLSFRSIFGFIMQILDITLERILDRLGRRIGRERIERLRRMVDMATGVWDWVRTLLTEGPAGLWRSLRERLSGLWSMVVSSIVNWLSSRLIATATARLMTLLDPTGIMAVVNSLIALYRAIESFVQYLVQMLEIVSKVLDGVLDIARGAIGTAAGYLESALASAIPVAIGFLANQFGFGRLGRRIGEMVEGIRERVNRAIDWLIDRAIRAGRAFLNLLRRGARAVRRGFGRLREWWRAEARFTTADGERHRLYIQGRGRDARLMIASEPKTYRQYVMSLDLPAEREPDRRAALKIADELDRAMQAAAREGRSGETDPGATESQAQAIQLLMEQLQAATEKLVPPNQSRSTVPNYGGLYNGFGTSVRVERLTDKAPDGADISSKGSAPASSLTNQAWEYLRQLNIEGSSDSSNDRFYVRGHLLNDNLGGPGDTWQNLTPLSQVANNRGGPRVSHLRGFEEPVKGAVLIQRKQVNFMVTAKYGRKIRSDAIARLLDPENATDEDRIIANILKVEHTVPTKLVCKAEEIVGKSAKSKKSKRFKKKFTVRNVDRQGRDVSNIPVSEFRLVTNTPRKRVYISDMSASELAELKDIDSKMAARIYASGKKPFRRWQTVYEVATGTQNASKEKVDKFREAVQGTRGYSVKLYKVR